MKAIQNEGYFLAVKSYEIVSLVEDRPPHTPWFIDGGIRYASLYKGISLPSTYQRSKNPVEFDISEYLLISFCSSGSLDLTWVGMARHGPIL